MDLASLVGLILGVVMVVFGIISSGGTAALGNFIDPPSIIITIGGSLASTLFSHKLPDFINGLKGITLAIKEPTVGNPVDVISNIINLSNISRKEGLLALEEAYNEYGDEIDIIAINSIRYEVAAVEAVQDNIDELNLSFKVLYDTDKLTKDRYDLKQRPSTVLFNRDGEQVDIYTEALDHTKLLELMMEIK